MVNSAIAGLEAMSPPELRSEWERLYGAAAPNLSPALLVHGLAYRIQMQASGMSEVPLARMLARKARPDLKPGTQLVRSWNGRTIMVTVVEGGFLLDDVVHASLSAIAKLVTGAHWSGPRFFGLTDNG